MSNGGERDTAHEDDTFRLPQPQVLTALGLAITKLAPIASSL
jgi:hypothetical protein